MSHDDEDVKFLTKTFVGVFFIFIILLLSKILNYEKIPEHFTWKGIILLPYFNSSKNIANRAGMVDIKDEIKEVLDTLRENSPGKLKVLEMFRQHNISEGAGWLIYWRAYTPFKKLVERWDIIDDSPKTVNGKYQWGINLEAFFEDDFILTKTGEAISEREDKGQMRVMYEAYRIWGLLQSHPYPPFKLLKAIYLPPLSCFIGIYQKTRPFTEPEARMLVEEAIKSCPEEKKRYEKIYEKYVKSNL